MGDPYPLSCNQELLLAFAAEAGFDVSSWNQQVVFDLREYDGAGIRETLRRLCLRHGILRTRIGLRGSRHCQVVDGPSDHLPHRVAEGTHTTPDAVARAELAVPFDLYQGPLFRTVALPRPDGGAWLVLTVNHLVSDRQSEVMLAAEFARCYERAGSGNSPDPLPEQYADFARWQRGQVARYLRDPASAPDWQRYENTVRACGPQVRAPVSPPVGGLRPPAPVKARQDIVLAFTRADMGELAEYCRAQKATLNTVFLAAVKSAIAGVPRLAIGLLLGEKTIRPLRFTDTLGPFPDLWPITEPTRTAAGFPTVLSSVRGEVLRALETSLPFHVLVQHTPWLLRQLHSGHRSRWMLYQYFNDTAGRADRRTRVAGIEFPDAYGEERGIFGIHLHMRVHRGVLGGTLNHCTDAFCQSSILEFVDTIREVLRQATGRPLEFRADTA
jgi:Condensation domain